MSEAPVSGICNYYVDEAGDPSLFKKRGKVIVGKEGCSSYFILGLAVVKKPTEVSNGLESLRKDMLADPYFSKVPSFQPERNKTAIAFHAKDDLPEVRREVFKYLLNQDIRFHAVVREKTVVLEKVQKHQLKKADYKYHPNQLYDTCISRLFQSLLHKAEGYNVYFARRGSSDRTSAFESALSQARHNFMRKHGIGSSAPIQIIDSTPNSTVNLQVVDYYLWALQRAYEKGEDRFIQLVQDQIGAIHDVDDTRESWTGVHYFKRNTLSSEKIVRGS